MTLLEGQEISDNTFSCIPYCKGWDFQNRLHVLQAFEAWWYTTPLASQLIRKQVGGFIFDVGLLGPCGKHAEEAEDVARVAKACLGRCQGMPRTL